MTHCTQCGSEIDADDAYCPECGAAVNAADEADDVDLRDDWWHAVVPVAPLAIPVLGGTIGTLLFLPFWLLYPVALWNDGKYVRAVTDGSEPGTKVVALAGALGLFSLGLLSWLISPYYLYKRRGWVGTP